MPCSVKLKIFPMFLTAKLNCDRNAQGNDRGTGHGRFFVSSRVSVTVHGPCSAPGRSSSRKRKRKMSFSLFSFFASHVWRVRRCHRLGLHNSVFFRTASERLRRGPLAHIEPSRRIAVIIYATTKREIHRKNKTKTNWFTFVVIKNQIRVRRLGT